MNPQTRPLSLVREVRHAYCHTTERLESICARYGVYVSTVRTWRARYGWPKRQGVESRMARPKPKGPSKICPTLGRFDYFPPHQDSRVTRWRCCDRINTGPQCETCKHTPEWAKAS